MTIGAAQRVTVDDAIEEIGLGRFQWRLLGVNGLVWASDAMEILAIGFVIPSIIVSFGIERTQAALVASIFFAGMMLGAWSCGVLADKFGRRNVFLGTVLMNAVFALASAFAPSFGWLLALRFLTGVAVGGTLPVDYAIMAEYLPRRDRGRFLVYLESFWAVGTVLIALIAWAVIPSAPESGWRWIFGINALPGFLGLMVRWWIPESPRYLLLRGREEEARAVLAKVARINGREGAIPLLRPVAAAAGNTTAALFKPLLRQRTLWLSVIWFFLSLGYYGIFTWLPNIFAAQGFGFVRAYGYLVLLALAQLPGYALAAYLVDRIGRQATLAAFLFGSAAACMLFALATSQALIITGSMLLSFSLLGAWGAVYAFTPELYPTEARATGMGWAGAMARAAGIIAPSLGATLLAVSLPLALSVYALSLAIAGGAALFIRQDTSGVALEDSLEASR